MSSCHRVRQEAAVCWVLHRTQLRVGHEVSLVLSYPRPFPVFLCNMREENPEDLLGWSFCWPSQVSAVLWACEVAGKSAVVGLKFCQSLSSIL